MFFISQKDDPPNMNNMLNMNKHLLNDQQFSHSTPTHHLQHSTSPIGRNGKVLPILNLQRTNTVLGIWAFF